uniref:Retrovirus-related Pol polyprotein from type-1 retrotransposable element R2 n=1 Tax=Lygus hesperus TaxID=30085 RepID=A0A146L0U7_LYGHE
MVKVVDGGFVVGQSPIPARTVLEVWWYLRVDFMGVATIAASRVDLGRALKRVTKAPLKPQQKLRLLRTYLLPKLTYGLVFGRLTAGRLLELDREIRSAVRSWLQFPPGVPSAYIHAPVKFCGLGIVSLSASIPSLRRRRLLALRGSSWEVARAAADLDFVRQQLAWCDRATPTAPKPSSPAEFAAALHESVDGKELRQCSESPISSQWVEWASEGIGARDYRNFHAVRVASLPTAVRFSRITNTVRCSQDNKYPMPCLSGRK